MTDRYDPDSYWEARGGLSYRDYVESPPYAVYQRAQAEFFQRLVRQLQPQTLLDFGCGTGRLFPLWREIPDVHAYDRSYSQLQVAEQTASALRPSNRYRIASPCSDRRTRLPYENGHFDLIVTAEVLLHVLPDEVAALVAELHRICRGWLAVVTAAPFDNPAAHNFDHPYDLLLSGLFTITEDRVQHRQRYLVGRKTAASTTREAARSATVATCSAGNE